MFCIIAVTTACKKDQLQAVSSTVDGGLNITIEKGQQSNNGIIYNQTPAWVSVWNTHGDMVNISPTDALQGIANDATANKSITADYHDIQASSNYQIPLAPGTYMVFVMLSMPANATGQFAYSYKTFTVTSTGGYVTADKKFSADVASAVFENWN